MDEAVTLPPELQGRYRVRSLLGSGGMGTVLLAEDLELERMVALKLLQEPECEDQRTRFLREARRMAEIVHPHLVRLLDFGPGSSPGSGGGVPYLVMEYLEGSDLADAPGEDPLGDMLQAAEGLMALHAAGIVHRDLKPENILRTRGGRVVVADLGLARALEDRTLTASDMVVGTPDYVAPEILDGAEATPASDWFAWGLTLCVLREGRLPWEERPMNLYLERGSLPPPRFRRLPADSPEARLITRCLSVNPSRRPAGLPGIRRLLGTGGGRGARPPTPGDPAEVGGGGDSSRDRRGTRELSRKQPVPRAGTRPHSVARQGGEAVPREEPRSGSGPGPGPGPGQVPVPVPVPRPGFRPAGWSLALLGTVLLAGILLLLRPPPPASPAPASPAPVGTAPVPDGEAARGLLPEVFQLDRELAEAVEAGLPQRYPREGGAVFRSLPRHRRAWRALVARGEDLDPEPWRTRDRELTALGLPPLFEPALPREEPVPAAWPPGGLFTLYQRKRLGKLVESFSGAFPGGGSVPERRLVHRAMGLFETQQELLTASEGRADGSRALGYFGTVFEAEGHGILLRQSRGLTAVDDVLGESPTTLRRLVLEALRSLRDPAGRELRRGHLAFLVGRSASFFLGGWLTAPPDLLLGPRAETLAGRTLQLHLRRVLRDYRLTLELSPFPTEEASLLSTAQHLEEDALRAGDASSRQLALYVRARVLLERGQEEEALRVARRLRGTGLSPLSHFMRELAERLGPPANW